MNLKRVVLVYIKKQYIEDNKPEHIQDIGNFYNNISIFKYGSGSIVAVVDSDIWMIYFNIPDEELIKAINEIQNIKPELRDCIYFKIKYEEI